MLQKQQMEELLKDKPFSALWEIIYHDIFDDVIQGNLMPGDKISEIQISGDLGISRSPVNKAIEKLIDEKILQRNGKRVATVANLTSIDYFELYEARVMLEGTAAYLAAKRINNENLSSLKTCLEKIKNSSEQNDFETYRYWEKAFHRTIVNATGNKYFIHLYEELFPGLSRYQFTLTKIIKLGEHDSNWLKGEYRKHKQIYSAIANGLAVEAEDAIKTDLSTMYRTICQLK